QISTCLPLPPAYIMNAALLSRFPEHAEETLNTIDQALELDPRSIDAHEHRAILLANHGRFDDAIAACTPDVYRDRPPMQLKARAAVIVSQRGDVARAIALMRGVVETDPDYAWAWSQLSQLLQHANQPKDALAAAKKLTQLAPSAPASWGYVAECLASQDELDEAKAYLKRSIELDPSYLYGGNALFSMQIDAEEYDDAIETLRTIGPHLNNHDRAAREARVQAMAGRSEESLAAIGRASRAATEGDDLLLEAVDALLLAGWAEPLKNRLLEIIHLRQATPQAVATYVEVLTREARLTEIEDLCNAFDPTTPHWAEAAAVYVEALGDARRHDRLDAFVDPRRDLLRCQTRSWGRVGAALQRSDRFRESIAWMDDWRDRKDSEPHMLASLALSGLSLRDSALVREVVNRIVSMPLAAATDTARVIGAAAEVFDCDASAALGRLEAVAPQNLSPYHQSLYWLLRAGVEGALHLDAGGRWREAWATWSNAIREHYDADGDELYQSIVARSRLLLTERRGNPLLRWLAELKMGRLRERDAVGSAPR
ncbi:MAG: tetratricopeptide repeat protein, partial [Planctomycetota bacterium]